MVCPACRYVMDDFDKECPRCHGKGIASPQMSPQPPDSSQASVPQSTALPAQAHPSSTDDVAFLPSGSATNGMQMVGGLLLGLGLLWAAYFFLFFDTSVAVPEATVFGTTIGGGRVNNIGLMAQRQNGILIGIGLAIIGAVLFAVGQNQSNSGTLANSTATPSASSDRDISILFILSAFLPIGGIVLCLVNMDRPDRAKAAAYGTGVGFVLGLVIFGLMNAGGAQTKVENTFGKPVPGESSRVPDTSPRNSPSVTSTTAKSYSVEYEVISQEGGLITYINGQGGIQQITDAPDEWEQTLTASSGSVLTLSCQSKADYGNVWVTIYVDGELVSTSDCEGAYCVASTNYVIP